MLESTRMPDVAPVPLSLFHTGRAQCPDCGAALALVDQQALVRCQYCGGTAVVERRLRTLEPVIPGEFVMADAPVETSRWIHPSQVIGTVAQDESHCPTCGIELGAADKQAIRTCGHCGTQSKIERRLLRSLDADVLYRLLYLKGPVQAWALELAKGQMGLGCRFPMPTLLHFIDDCAAERPELVPHIRKCFYVGLATTEAEFVGRLKLVDELLTAPAKAAVLEHLYAPPETANETVAAESLARLLALTSDPTIGSSAVKAIVNWIDENIPLRECLHQMVRERGDELPEDIRRSYLRKVPETKCLSPLAIKYQNVAPKPRSAFDQQLEEWKQMWDAGIRAAAMKHAQKQAAAREYWKKIPLYAGV